MDGMGVGILGILTNGKDDTSGIPQIEELIEKGMDNVGAMVLRDGNVDIMGIPPRRFPLVPLDDRIYGSDTLDETLGPNMVGG